MAPKEHGQSTTDVRTGYQLDPASLEPYLQKSIPGFAVPVKVSQFKLGQSNPTYLLTDAKVYTLCEDVSVIGTPFYVMEFLEGRIFSDITLTKLPFEERRL
ncbi:hypothetical protein BGZ92_006077, partial [Podila epicladia]